jgi:hypothetical protein
MDSRLLRVAADPANEIFAVVFFPDRIYHEAYLNATRSPRYRYNVQEVRGYYEVTCLKGQVFLDGGFLSNFIRIEYRGGRLTEMARVKNRFLRNSCAAWIRLTDLAGNQAATTDARPLVLHYDDWINAYQAEIWETLEPPGSINHAAAVLAIMGRGGEITRISQFAAMLTDVKSVGKVELAFREPDRYYPFGRAIPQNDIAWDNNFGRTHQAPVKADEPSASENTLQDLNYLLDFQRGWYKQASDVVPVLYRNAMMMARPDGTQNPDARDDNIIAMRWLFQRELGGLLFAGRGIPMFFMGEEILEDKQWNDDINFHANLLIWWDGLKSDVAMQDYLHFCRDLVWLRRNNASLKSEALRVGTRNSVDRVMSIHRWIEGVGADLLLVANLQEMNHFGYRIGFPGGGRWREVFNSDFYDTFPNPHTVGNGGSIETDGLGWDGMPASAQINLPANGFIVFTR